MVKFLVQRKLFLESSDHTDEVIDVLMAKGEKKNSLKWICVAVTSLPRQLPYWGDNLMVGRLTRSNQMYFIARRIMQVQVVLSPGQSVENGEIHLLNSSLSLIVIDTALSHAYDG